MAKLDSPLDPHLRSDTSYAFRKYDQVLCDLRDGYGVDFLDMSCKSLGNDAVERSRASIYLRVAFQNFCQVNWFDGNRRVSDDDLDG